MEPLFILLEPLLVNIELIQNWNLFLLKYHALNISEPLDNN